MTDGKHPELALVAEEFARADRRLRALVQQVSEDRWAKRAYPDRWSVAECIAHINLTSAAYIPLIREGIAKGHRIGGPIPSRYRRDFMGWLLWRGAGPPVRVKVKTTAPFVPTSTDPPGVQVEDFDRLQREQIACVHEADGLPLDRIMITSPFNSRLKYNLFSCLTILPPHEHRHLWQAEQVWQGR